MSDAVGIKERSHIPLVGASLDRRALQSVGEVFNKSHISMLICFICACKHVHYSGYNMFGNVVNKGTIHYIADSQRLKKRFPQQGSEEPNAS